MTSRLHPTDAPSSTGRIYVSIAPAVCERLLGEPSGRSTREWRWGRKGSFRLKLDTGTWSDFEAGEGGGVLALVMREERLDKAGALAWLESQSFLSSLSGRGKVGAYGSVSRKAVAAQSPYSPAIKVSTTITPDPRGKDALRWIRSQILPIADAHDHPIRRWMAKRNLWRPELPLPPSLRWIPADAPIVSGERTRALARSRFRLRRSRLGEQAYPETPATCPRCSLSASTPKVREPTTRTPREIELTSRSSATPGLPYGPSGTCRGDRVVVCEGAADALALAARETDPVIATLTTPRPPLAWRDALSVFDLVTLWPDMDEEDELGRRAGLDASVALAQARKLAGQSIDVMGVDIGKDAADAARESSLNSIDTEELHRFAQELEGEGMARFEALRYASTLLK